MKNPVFVKAIENLRNHGGIKLVTKERRRNHLVSGPDYHTIKFLV